MNRLILLVESRIRGDVYVRFGGELPKTHRSNTAGRWMLSLLTNFARILNKPVFFSFGYNDMVCPPTTSYVVYNSISSPKTFIPAPETEHYNYPELWEEAWKWGEELLKAPKK